MRDEAIRTFLHSQTYAVIATAGKGGAPESALIGFGDTDELEIIFGTDTTMRKYQNLTENPRVAFTIGLGGTHETVQYEGVARELSRGEWDTYLPRYFAKNPAAQKYRNGATQAYFLMMPRWIRHITEYGNHDSVRELRADA